MVFTTYWFLLFSVGFISLYWAVRVPWLRLVLLLVFCSVFHAKFAGAAGMVPILALCVTTYLAGLSRQKWLLGVGMALPVLALVFYKYTHFLSLKVLALLSPQLGAATDQLLSSHLPATPPLGVSFFAFEFVHYLYDVRKGQPSIRNPAHFWAFTFFFPSLVAGPVKRYQLFLPSLQLGLQRVSLDDVKYGLWRIATGYFKKVMLADNLTAGLRYWEHSYHALTIPHRWLFVAALALRILFDFSGYSDIAIGLSRLMGIRLPENFCWPYVARNLQDFWRRWHISLSSWIRDYVYIPLGGGRQGPLRRALNALLAFSLCGLWHGPDWNFLCWGVWHGAGLAVAANYASILGPPGRGLAGVFARFPILPWAITLLFVSLGWLGFFYPLPQAAEMTRLLFSRQ